MRFEIVKTTMGITSIKDNLVNEIMHNPVGPWSEANALYIEQSQFKKKIYEYSLTKNSEPFVVFDVGFGSGTNAIATIQAYLDLEQTANQELAPLKIVSFEKDLDLARFTLSNINQFEYLSKHQELLEALVEKKQFKFKNIECILRYNDFTEAIKSETNKAMLVFFDPYSPQMNKEMWTYKNFKNLKQAMNSESGCLLLTYSRATPVRAAMLAAGLFVGYGMATGLKEETTQAATKIGLLDRFFGSEWLLKWKRSGNPYPFDFSELQQEEIKRMIEEHPQFIKLPPSN